MQKTELWLLCTLEPKRGSPHGKVVLVQECQSGDDLEQNFHGYAASGTRLPVVGFHWEPNNGLEDIHRNRAAIDMCADASMAHRFAEPMNDLILTVLKAKLLAGGDAASVRIAE